jgi:phage-related holin
MIRYLETVLESVKPLYVFFATIVAYVLFPTKAYETAASVLACAVILDVVTKYYAIGRKNGGLWNAIRTGHISSRKLWEGTFHKVFIYLILMILAGLSIRVSPIEQIATFFASFVYLFLFAREAQSCIENLLSADENNEWLRIFLVVLKKEEKKLLKKSKSK